MVSISHVGAVPIDIAPQDVLRHHHLKSGQLLPCGDPVMGRIPLLANDDIVMYRCRPVQPQDELYRNARADEIIFVHHGHGTLHTMFGVLPFRALDYIVIPRCTTYRLDFDTEPQPDMLVIESTGIVRIPADYLNPDGQIRLGAPIANAICTGRANWRSSIERKRRAS